ncbi:MAG TPA: aspartate/glutamate racemase family protein [Candidatus Saccharimonadales bacterium]|nr:aspartate/glutamate racemase family protein [Candidatus Saccharimonadales bacterium]
MKTIGLIGGMSWESSQEYYRIINETARERLGGLHSARSLMFSFDFAEIEELQHAGNWDEATRRMVGAAQNLEKGGADFLLICTNTMHKMAKEVQAGVEIPLLHIADPTGQAIKAQGIAKIALLGTKYTMEHDFYKGRLQSEFGLEIIVPDEADRQTVHDVIYDELCVGVVKDESKQKYQQIIERLKTQGAEGVILGCTEITLLIQQADTDLPVFDTTRIHAEAAVDLALQQ